MRRRCLHLRTSLTFKLDLSEALSQCQQMVVAYVGLAFSPWGAGFEKLFALRHRSVSCFPLMLSNPGRSTWELQLCSEISLREETQCATRANSNNFLWPHGGPLQQGVGILSSRVRGQSWRPTINHRGAVGCRRLLLIKYKQAHTDRFNNDKCKMIKCN